MGSCLTSFVSGSNRIAVILDSVVMVMANCLTLRVPRLKPTTLDRYIEVTVSCLTLFVPSWNRLAVIIDGVVTVMASCLTVNPPRRKEISVNKIIVGMASCPT